MNIKQNIFMQITKNCTTQFIWKIFMPSEYFNGSSLLQNWKVIISVWSWNERGGGDLRDSHQPNYHEYGSNNLVCS